MRKITSALLLLAFCAPPALSQKRVETKIITVSPLERIKLSETLNSYRVVEIDIAQFKKDVSSLEETRVLWEIDSSLRFDIKMYPHEVRSSSFEAITVGNDGIQKADLPEIITYKGYLPDGHSVRLTIDDGFIYGKIETDKGIIKIDQLKYMIKDKSIPSNKIVIYELTDVKETNSECGTPNVKIEEKSSSSKVAKSSSAGCSIIELILDCDTDYFDDYENNSHARMLAEINMIQEMYEDDIDAILSVTRTAVFATGNFYTSTNGNTILSEINNVWTSWPYSSYSRDMVHHFTGKNTGPFGQASRIGAACDDPNPRAWSEDRANVDQTMAHEIGHLLNGRHNEGTNCGVPFTRSVMCQGDNKDYAFSAASITRLTNFIDDWSQCFNYNTTYIYATNGNICVNDTKTVQLLNFSDTAGTDIVWSTNSRLQLTSGQGNTIATVRGISNGQGVVTATINGPGGCGNVVETKNIYVGPEPLSVSAWVDSYGWASISITGGSPPYQWNFNFNSSSGTSNSSYFNVYVGCNGGVFQVESTGSCGTAYGSTYIGSCSGGGYYSTAVYPNPASNEINVVEGQSHRDEETPRSVLADFITLTLYDFNASIVRSIEVDGRKGDLKMNLEELKKGHYFLKVKGSQIEETHQILVE